MKPLRLLQPPPEQIPQVTGNGVVLTVAQYSWGSGTSRRVVSADPSAVPIVDVPSHGDTIALVLATSVRPSFTLISTFSQLEADGTPTLSSETTFDCEQPGTCDISENADNVTIRITAPGAQMVTLRTAFDVPSETSDAGIGEPFTASWVARLVP